MLLPFRFGVAGEILPHVTLGDTCTHCSDTFVICCQKICRWPVTLTGCGGADGGKDLQRAEGRELKQEAFNNLMNRDHLVTPVYVFDFSTLARLESDRDL